MGQLTIKEVEALAEKFLNGTITPSEEILLDEWYGEILPPTLELESHGEDKEAFRQRLLQKIRDSGALQGNREKEHFVRSIKLWRLAAAAIFVVFAGISIYYIVNRPKDHNLQAKVSHPVEPGHDGALLTLSDGRQILLDSTSNGSIALQGNSQVIKQGGMLQYVNDGKAGREVIFNTMTTARGRQFRLILPDGSKVWLNASSSIRYPTEFSGKERNIQIEGEAYFEVVKNKKQPFIVKTPTSEITVLGTHFDVMTYKDEERSVTTLLEGSVKVTKSPKEIIIKPGQEAVIDHRTNQLFMQDADTVQAIAWVKGKLSLKNLDVATLMRQLSRWYDVDIRYEGRIPDGRFGGILNRNAELSTVLQVLQSDGIHTSLDNNTITVYDK